MFFGKNRKAELLKSVFILAAMVSAYTMQFSDVCEASSKASTHKVTKKSDKKEITKTKAGATKSSKKSSKSNRKMNTDLKGFIEDFSSTVLTTQKSHLAENDLKEALKNIAKNYVDIAGLCPFLFGSNYKKVDKKTRKELIEGGIIASMVAQHLLKLLPHKKSVSTSVKSTKNIRGKSWSVKTVYKVNRESTEQTYNVIFSVKETGKSRFLISNVDVEGIDGKKLLRDEVKDMISKSGIQKTIEKLRKEM